MGADHRTQLRFCRSPQLLALLGASPDRAAFSSNFPPSLWQQRGAVHSGLSGENFCADSAAASSGGRGLGGGAGGASESTGLTAHCGPLHSSGESFTS